MTNLVSFSEHIRIYSKIILLLIKDSLKANKDNPKNRFYQQEETNKHLFMENREKKY